MSHLERRPWLAAFVLMANDIGAGYSFLLLIVTSVLLFVVVRKVPGTELLASRERDREVHRE